MLNIIMYMSVFFVFIFTTDCYSEQIINERLYESGVDPVFVATNKGVFVAYNHTTIEDHSIFIKKIGSNEETEIKGPGQGRGVNIVSLKDALLLVFRLKDGEGKKYVYVQRSLNDAKTFTVPTIINSAADALQPIITITDGNEKVYVVWLDERQKDLRLFMNYSLDGGKSFLQKDLLLTKEFIYANLPVMLLQNNRLDLFFYGTRVDDVTAGIYHIYSEDGGNTFSNPTCIDRTKGWAPFTIQALRTPNGKIIIFWAGIEGLYSAYSVDGKVWVPIVFKETHGKDIYRLDVKQHVNRIYIASSWVTRFAINEKPNVYFYLSEDSGHTWSLPIKINTNEYNSTSSTFPSMAVSKDGKAVFIAWQDHRNIRGGIFANYSKDGGRTWLEKDFMIEKNEGKFNSSYPYVVEHDNKFHILWKRFKDDLRVNADLYYTEYEVK